MMPQQKIGDMNYDGKIDFVDASSIAYLILHEQDFLSGAPENRDYSKYKIADWEIHYADTNQDQVVDYKDFKIYYNDPDNFEKTVKECINDNPRIPNDCSFKKEQLGPLGWILSDDYISKYLPMDIQVQKKD